MRPEDLAALHARCFTTPRPWSAAEFAAMLESPGAFLIGDASGFVLGRVAAGEAELLTLAVAPGARRRGLGRGLLEGFEAGAARRGAGTAFLEVAAGNAPARALYAAAGWDRSGLRPGYYRHPDGSSEDALVLCRRLAPCPGGG
ncbi:MAG: GNAT family N-acetyltransferase [Gemmobacter sp.]